ncbi:predicted protein [Uncinocarpus reesii 1704]|uniref:Uncharacterized protein n=1 Tax=Uncinocarpus reesii (strain UAMH 1704) TaxID=336963 RepID=C4JTT0_UNCRE|nr:uncharacterized protein UREG_05869 [Uncinocarpus reesii 1704]EEP81027.1 predicted protein [Uncinocarpus reesii 1704]
MAVKTLSLSELRREFLGKDCLQGWDILVSYHTSVLNEILRQRASKIDGLTKIPEWPAVWVDPITSETVTSTVSISLSNPTISFKDSQASVVVTFHLTGESRRENSSAPDVLPPGLLLQLDTKLVDVRGTVAGSGAAAEIHTSPSENGEAPSRISILEPGTEHARAVAIDFRSGTITIVPETGVSLSEDQTVFVNCIATDIQEHFQKSVGLDCYLGSVSNKTATGTLSSLKPTTFSFSTIASDARTPGVLCMWIGVEGGAGNYTVPDEGLPLQMKINTTAYNPVPKDHTASIIFSHHIMANKFFLPALAASNMSNAKCETVLGNPGMKFLFNLPSLALHVDKVDELGSNILVKWHRKLDAVDFNMKDSSVWLEIGEKVAINWSHEVKLKWSFYRDPTFGNAETTQGDITMTFKVVESGDWKLAGNKVGFVIRFPEKFGITVVASEKSDLEKLFLESEQIPEEYKKISMEIPVADVELDSMDYFLTTNLVFPGYTSFVPGNPDNGLVVPRDTIITGEIKTWETKSDVTAKGAEVQSLPVSLEAANQIYGTNESANEPGVTALTKSTDVAAATEDILANVATPPVQSPPIQVITKPASQLPKDLLDPKGAFFRDITRASLDKESPLRATLRVLDQHGYGQVTEAEINQMLNVATPKVENKDPTTEVNKGRILQEGNAQSSLFSLNLFSGRYIIDGSSRELIVNAHTGRIKVDGVEAVPTFSTDPITHITTTTWNVPSKTYSVVFSSDILDDDTFQPNFTGKVNNDDISGKRRILDSKDKRILSANASDIITILGFSVGHTLTLIGLGLAIRWRPRDKIQQDPAQPELSRRVSREEAEKLLKQSEKAGAAKQEIIIELKDMLKDNSEHKADARASMADVEGVFMADVNKLLETESTRIRDSFQGEAVQQLAEGSGEAFEAQVTTINEMLRQRVETYVQQNISPSIHESLMVWKQVGIMTEGEIGEIAKNCLKPLIERQLADLTKKEAGKPSVAEAIVKYTAIEKHVLEREAVFKDIEAATRTASEVETGLNKTYTEKETAIKQKETAKDNEMDAERKKVLERQLETLKKELEAKKLEREAAAKDALEKSNRLKKERVELEKKQKNRDLERKKKIEAVEAALKKKHHHR